MVLYSKKQLLYILVQGAHIRLPGKQEGNKEIYIYLCFGFEIYSCLGDLLFCLRVATYGCLPLMYIFVVYIYKLCCYIYFTEPLCCYLFCTELLIFYYIMT